jgi:hypothetical protein
MRDLIFVSLENWDDVWRRNQFICASLLRRFRHMRLLFVERARDVSHAVRTLQFSGLGRPALRQEAAAEFAEQRAQRQCLAAAPRSAARFIRNRHERAAFMDQ